MRRLRSASAGFTLIELMIGMAIGVIVVLAAGTLMGAGARFMSQQDMQAAAEEDAQVIYRIVADIIMQSESCPPPAVCTNPPVTITTSTGAALNPNPAGILSQAGDSFKLTGTLPAGFKIWPNDDSIAAATVPPYQKPAVQLLWDYTTGNLTVSVGTVAAPATSTATLVAGSTTAKTSRIVNIDAYPLAADGVTPQVGGTPAGGYQVCVVTRAPKPDKNYTNPNDLNDPVAANKNYRTAQICGVVVPRNF